MGVVVVLGLLQSFAALIPAATLYAIMREQDPDVAMFGRSVAWPRASSAVLPNRTRWHCPGLATSTTTNAADTGSAGAWSVPSQERHGGHCNLFAVGSTFFSYLLLHGRMIPIPLAWLGVVASVLLVVGLPVQAAGFLRGPITSVIWLPMLAFESPLGFWLIVKGVARSAPAQSA